MQKFKGIYLYIDMDGTTLDDNKKISGENIAAINKFIENGGSVGIASGRSPYNLGHFRDILPINAPSILFNGAALYDYSKESYLYSWALNKNLCSEIIEKSLAIFPDLGIQIFTKSGIYEPNSKQITDPFSLLETFDRISRPFTEISEDWNKMLFCHEPENIDKLIDILELDKYRKIMNIEKSTGFYLEFVPSNKGKALKKLKELLKNEITKTIAIGDFYNDIEMVKEADIGVAPQNAVHEVKEIAKVIVSDNNHSAVKDLLEKVVFSQKYLEM